jgi:hypothetical protein
MAYDPGYASLGGPAPVFVQAKPSWARPGVVTASAVLAFIVGGLDLLASIGWFTTNEIAGVLGESQAEFVMYGMINLLIAVLLIAGGAGALGRMAWGRLLLYAGSGVGLLYAVYGLVMKQHYHNIIDIALLVLIAALVSGSLANRFFAGRDPTR